MPEKSFFVTLLLALLLTAQLQSQELLRSVEAVDFEISARQFEENSPGRRMFTSLAINNGKNLYQIRLYLQAGIFISIQKDSAQGQTLRLRVLNKRLSGDTYFRDFAIDSLLLPLTLSATLHLLNGNDSLKYPVVLPVSGQQILVELPAALHLHADSLIAHLQVDKVSYSQQSEQVFSRSATLINLYYAYDKILNELINHYNVHSFSRKQGDVGIFIAWHQISRVNHYIRKHGFMENLHLKEKDPLDFLKSYSLSERMEKRASTLFRQIINTQKKGNLSDKKAYCSAYAGLSQNYLNKAAQLQLYLASGFEEVAQIYPNPEEKKRLAELAALFDVFNRIDEASTPQLLYAHFIDFAKKAYNKSQFVVSLQMLKNALQIAEWFDDVVVSDAYIRLYNQSIDGVMTSYLKVSIIAYRAGKLEMSDQYYQKASLIYEEFGHLTFGNDTANPAFLQFTEKQLELSREFIADGEINKALLLLKQARQIRDCKSVNNDCPEIDSLIAQCLRGKFEMKMDTVDQWLIQKDYDSAWSALHLLKKFTDSRDAYFNPFPTQEFAQRAVLLFEVFFSRGEALLMGKYPEKALSWFLKAQQIERDFLPDQQDTRLKLLVYNATVPVILKEIEKADFETWANRMEIADRIYQHAKQLQHNYQQENNDELNAAFLSLESKMKQRTCVDYDMRIRNLNTIIVNRVNSGKFDLAATMLHEANTILKQQQHCGIDGAETRELEKKYAGLFAFQQQLKEVDAGVGSENYDSAIVQFVGLTSYYSKYKLDKFGLETPSLYAFIIEKGKPGLSREAVKYYIQTEEYLEALRYLDVLKNQHVPSGETRKLQQLVGRGIGYSTATEAEVQKYTEGEGWYIYFRLARLTTKIRKKTD